MPKFIPYQRVPDTGLLPSVMLYGPGVRIWHWLNALAVVLRDTEIPVFFGQRPMSLHQTAFTDVLAAAELTGKMPEKITLVGVQLADIEKWGGGLTAAVAGAMDEAIRIGLDELAAWAAEG